jgi:hypothetical protein
MTEDATIDALVADVLADESVWVEPSAGLEDAVVRAVAEAASPARRRPWRAAAAGMAAAAAATVVALVVGTGGGGGADYAGELAATTLAPGATASVELDRTEAGFRIELDADGLPELADGEHYQAWLKDPAGTVVAVGTFSSDDERVTLWSGVSPERFSQLTVTIEAADGDPASSGRLVLAGSVREG